MFDEVQSALRLDKRKLKEGTITTIEEEKDGLGSFLINHFLSSLIKEGNPVVFLGLEHSIGHYHGISLKLGYNLLKAKENGQVVFIEALKDYAKSYINDEDSNFQLLHETEDRLCKMRTILKDSLKSLQKNRQNAESTIIVDKLSMLKSLGFTPSEIVLFERFLINLSAEFNANLVLLNTKYVKPEEELELGDPMLNYLNFHSDLKIKVWPLQSGLCSSVSGNLSYDWRNGNSTGRVQFLTEEKNVRVFALGASSAVL